MTKTEQLLFEKQKELIELIDVKNDIVPKRYKELRDKLESEIATLDVELSEQKEINTTSEYCQCLEPDRESGYSYCMRCHKHVSDQRMEQLTREIEVTNEQRPVKDGEYFVKVYIKSEDDLPKEGKYYAHQKIYNEEYITRFDFRTPHRKLWKNQINWYFCPVDAPPKTEFKTVKSAEEILIERKIINKAGQFSDRDIYIFNQQTSRFDLIQAMENYASQFKTDLRLPTDKEIKNKALEIVHFDKLRECNYTQEMAVNFILIFAKWIKKYLKTKQ